jgi:transcriptional regulator with XRE-family HTH domain
MMNFFKKEAGLMHKMCERLISLRKNKKLNQSEVAKAVLISQQQYSKYEKGNSELSVHALVGLSRFYRVTTDYILGLSDFKENNDTLIQIYCDNKSVGAVVSDLMALSIVSRRAIIEQIYMRMLKELTERKHR